MPPQSLFHPSRYSVACPAGCCSAVCLACCSTCCSACWFDLLFDLPFLFLESPFFLIGFLPFIVTFLKPDNETIDIGVDVGHIQILAFLRYQNPITVSQDCFPLILPVETEVVPRFPCAVAERFACFLDCRLFQIR